MHGKWPVERFADLFNYDAGQHAVSILHRYFLFPEQVAERLMAVQEARVKIVPRV
jgi:hypothetical protein